MLQATIVLEGNGSCGADGGKVSSSNLINFCGQDSCAISADSSWLAVPAPLARSTSDVTSYSTNSSIASGPPAPLARSISDVTSYTTNICSRHNPSSAQQPSQQDEQQQCRPARQRLLLLQQLHARAKPAATAQALQLAGRWWHQDALQLSELLLLPDGTMAWLKQSHAAASPRAGKASSTSSSGITSSMAAAASKVMQLLSTSKHQAVAAAGSADDDEHCSCSWSLQPYECVAEWRGSWQLIEGNAKQGKLQLTFLASSLEGHQQGSGCTRSQQQTQQHAVVSFERGALEDVLVLDGLAHIRLT
jgi:hypothetical protein